MCSRIFYFWKLVFPDFLGRLNQGSYSLLARIWFLWLISIFLYFLKFLLFSIFFYLNYRPIISGWPWAWDDHEPGMTMSLDDHESAPGAQTGWARQQCIYSLLRGYAVSDKFWSENLKPPAGPCITMRDPPAGFYLRIKILFIFFLYILWDSIYCHPI